MKLYLSSNSVPNPTALAELVGKPLTRVKLALIPNAKDYYSERLRQFKINQGVQKFVLLGIDVTVVDLRKYRNATQLKSLLGDFDVIWGYGGNTFCLRYEMEKSSFDSIIHGLLADGVLYGGESAGAVVAGKSLKGIELADVPEAAEEIIWEGMDLVDKVIMPHADNINFESAVVNMRALYKNSGSYIELNDDQALIVDGTKVKVVSREETA